MSSCPSQLNPSRTRSSIGHCSCLLCFAVRLFSLLRALTEWLWMHNLTGYYNGVTPRQISIRTCNPKTRICRCGLGTSQRRPFKHRLRHAHQLAAICSATPAMIIRRTHFLTAEKLVRLLQLLPCEQTRLRVRCASVRDVVVWYGLVLTVPGPLISFAVALARACISRSKRATRRLQTGISSLRRRTPR